MEDGSLAAFVAILAISPAWIVLTHATLSRLCPRSPAQLVAMAAGFAGAWPTALLTCAAASLCPRDLLEKPVEAVYGVVVYTCVAYSYFHLFNMSETARRIRILSEIYRSGSLTADQLSRLYDAAAVLGMRLDRLLATRQLVRRADRFVNAGRSFYAVACLIRAWRLVLGFEQAKSPRSRV
jgi:hypothetical protein